MSQSLEINMKGRTDIPETVDKVKKATNGLEKQVEAIGKKYSETFKDVILGFLAPMVLINSAINYISAAIDKRKADIKEALDFAAKGESQFLDAETAYLAQRQADEERIKKEKEMAETARVEVTKKELEKGGQFGGTADKIIGQLFDKGKWFKAAQFAILGTYDEMARDKEVQKMIGQMIVPGVDVAKVNQNNPLTNYSNVIGVGPNPVIDSLNAQLDEQRRTNEILQSMAPAWPTKLDFTKQYHKTSPWTYEKN